MRRTFAGTLLTIAAASICLLATAPGATAAPANDNFAGAQVIGPGLPLETAASNVGATVEPAEPSIGGNAVSSSIWFKWTAPSSQTTVINLCGSGFTGSDYPFEKFAVRTSLRRCPGRRTGR